jgi:hypothetical protein
VTNTSICTVTPYFPAYLLNSCCIGRIWVGSFKLGTVVCIFESQVRAHAGKSSSQLCFVASLSASPESFGRRPKRGSGSSELRLQTTIKIGRFPKVSLVTPNTRVRPAPIRPPVTLPALEMDIRVANKVASIPGGHNFAASTKTGINEAYKKNRTHKIVQNNSNWN